MLGVGFDPSMLSLYLPTPNLFTPTMMERGGYQDFPLIPHQEQGCQTECDRSESRVILLQTAWCCANTMILCHSPDTAHVSL